MEKIIIEISNIKVLKNMWISMNFDNNWVCRYNMWSFEFLLMNCQLRGMYFQFGEMSI